MKQRLMYWALLNILTRPTIAARGLEEDEAAAKAKAEADAKAKEEEAKKPRYTQADLDKHIGKFKFGMEAELKKAEAAARTMAEDKRLTVEERDAHAKRADELEAQYKSQKQLEEERVKKLNENHQKELEKHKNEATTYKTKYETMLVDNALSDGTATADEAIPGKLKKFLKPDTILTDEIGDDGKPTGNKVARVNFEDKDKDGKPVKLILSVNDAVKRMKELPEEYGIFFKGMTQGGVGGGNAKGGASGGTMPEDTAAYIARKKAMKKAS